MNFRLFFYFLLIFILTPVKTYAFLPPEFFTQGISSIASVIAGGIAMAVFPVIIFVKFTKNIFNKHKKIIILVIIQNVVIATVLGLFFYYKFYKPLYEDSYLFPKENSENINPLDRTIESNNPLDLKNFNKNYTAQGNLMRDNYKIISDHDYGIEPEEIEKKLNEKTKVYYLDIREKEEFDAGHILGSKNIRGADIKNTDIIKNAFGLSDKGFRNALIVVYCHNGDRSFYIAKDLNENNVKYLIGGTEYLDGKSYIPYTGSYFSDKKIFGDEYQKNFQILAQEASEMIADRQNTFVVDMRLGRVFAEKHVKGSLHFLYNTMPKEEYEKRIKKVLENKDMNMVFIVDRYTELFYTNLLIMRLEKNYQFDKSKFHILFCQFPALEKNHLIEFETGYPQT